MIITVAMMMLYMVTELMKKLLKLLFVYLFCYRRELKNNIFLKIETATRILLTKQIMLVARTQRQKNKGKGKPLQEREKKVTKQIMLVARTQRQKNKGKGKPREERKKKMKKVAIRGLDREEILTSPLNKFLISAFKIYSYGRHPPNGLYNI